MNNKTTILKEYFLNLVKEHKAAGARLVVTDKENIFFNECFGMASIERNEETKENTVYRIASISKTIAAIALMQLVEQGKLDLDEDLSNIFGFPIKNPNFPDDVITVRMLTTQTSSILDGYDDEELDADIPEKGYNGVNGSNLDCYLKDLLVPNDGPYYTPLTYAKYRPGSQFTYSNFGCGIMACVIEKISGEYFLDYMEKHIFKPLNIDANYSATRIINQDKIADMYQCYKENVTTVYNRERFINNPYKKFPLGETYRGPAGGLFINITDLTKLLQVLLNKGTLNGVKILESDTVEKMYQMQWFGYCDDTYKAKAIQMKVYDAPDPNFIYRGHTGGAYGVRSYFFFNLKQGIGACFITNGFLDHNCSYHAKTVFDGTLRKIAELFGNNITTTVNISSAGITLPERKIEWLANPINYELYPLMNIVDALDIVPTVTKDGTILLRKNNISINPELSVFNGIQYINLEYLLNTLKINYSKDKEVYNIVY